MLSIKFFITPKFRQWFSWLPASGLYRPDIDGLRALAVLAVVWFHAFPKRMPGGFVGVDIFFVISGFLISTILFREIESGKYRYYKFMARRVRRIFPALCTVLGATFLGGWLLLSQQELLDLGKQIGAGSLFFSNILFWNQSGYFDAASEFKPLLHLWSLGVEEQFYILYPPILWLAFRFRWKIPFILSVIFLASFMWGVIATSSAPAFAFFMLPTRFWELLCGGFVSLLVSHPHRIFKRPQMTQPFIQNIMSCAGLCLMTIAILWTRESDFPGFWALLPTLGASLFILAGPAAFLNRFVFSFQPIVAIGLISYPLYLWHWPLISFEHILSAGRPAEVYVKIAIVIAICLSFLTYRIIEKPLRHFSIKQTYIFLSPLVIITAMFAGLILLKNGFPKRAAASDLVVYDGEIDHVTFHEYGNKKYLPCEAQELLDNAMSYEGSLRCHQSRSGTDYDIILLGDSHAEHLFYGLAALLPQKNIVYAINLGLPIPENINLNKIYDYLLHKASQKRVDLILGGAWSIHLSEANVVKEIANTVLTFQNAGYRLFLTDDIPIFSFEPSRCKMHRRISLVTHKCSENIPSMEETQEKIERHLNSIARQTGAQILHTHEFFRDKDGYFMAKNGHLLYRDNNHLNINGSHYLAKKLQQTGQTLFWESPTGTGEDPPLSEQE